MCLMTGFMALRQNFDLNMRAKEMDIKAGRLRSKLHMQSFFYPQSKGFINHKMCLNEAVMRIVNHFQNFFAT